MSSFVLARMRPSPQGGISFPAIRPYLQSRIEILTRPTSEAVDEMRNGNTQTQQARKEALYRVLVASHRRGHESRTVQSQVTALPRLGPVANGRPSHRAEGGRVCKRWLSLSGHGPCQDLAADRPDWNLFEARPLKIRKNRKGLRT